MSKGTFGKVNNATAVERPPVIPANDYGATILLVNHFDFCSKWQAWVGGSKGARVEAFATSSEVTVKAWTVPARDTAASMGMRWEQSKCGKERSGKQFEKHC